MIKDINKLIDIGFEKFPNFNIMETLVFDLGRGRQLSMCNTGTPNEILFIRDNETTDLVVLSNYDYEGYLTIEKVINIIKSINHGRKDNKRHD